MSPITIRPVVVFEQRGKACIARHIDGCCVLAQDYHTFDLNRTSARSQLDALVRLVTRAKAFR